MSKSTCSACGEIFNSVKAFDAHRYGSFTDKAFPRSCRSKKGMLERGMTQNEKGWWITSEDPRKHQESEGTQ